METSTPTLTEFSHQFPEPLLAGLWRISGRDLEISVQTAHGCCSWSYVSGDLP